jgi:hypothetical protein
VLAFGLVAVGIVAAQVAVSQRAVNAADGSITGTVYRDFNSNGANDTAVTFGQATDIGVSGITVRAFDATGALVGQTTSGAGGSYSLAVTGASTTAVRVEFSLPTSGPLAAMKPSFAGTQNGTTIRFVEVGATSVDMGVNIPGEYCQSNPHIAVSRLCALNVGAASTAPTLWVTRFDGGPFTSANGYNDVYTSWPANTAGSMSTTKAVLGMAWDKRSQRVISAAYVRRLAPLYESPAGTPLPGALFTTTPNATSGTNTGGSTTFLVDLESLLAGDQFSNSNSVGPGYVPSNTARGLDDIMTAVDSDLVSGKDGVYEEVGKVGIGGIDSDDAGNLYVVSLYTRRLYKVSMPADGTAPTEMTNVGDIAANAPACTNGSARPFGVKVHRGAVYVGVVCDGAVDFDATNSTTRTSATDDGNITFSILKMDVGGAGAWSTEVGPISLFANGGSFKGASSLGPDPSEHRRWNPWADVYFADMFAVGGAWADVRPTPMLSDIEFDDDGSIIVGFRDRWGDQSTPVPGLRDAVNNVTANYAIASGDVYRICNLNGSYVFEGGTGCAKNFGNNTLGATDDEWFGADDFFTSHFEIGSGMLEKVPGHANTLMTAFDPSDIAYLDKIWRSGGVIWMVNSTGGKQRTGMSAGGGVLFYSNSATATPNSAGSFDKVNGMSDVEALCNMAPVQVGNRVWIDNDNDGIQDPGETPVAGATVRLYNAAGTLVGTAITNAQGEYYFASNVTEAVTGDANNVGGGLAVDAAFTVKLDNPADYAAGGPLNGYTLTSTDSTTTVTTDNDNSIDNDGALVGGSTYGVDKFPSISVAAHGPGENDHTFDFGFITTPPATTTPATTTPASTTPVGMGNYTWIDTDKDGLQDADEQPLAGVVVTLYNPDGTPVLDLAGKAATATTDAKGYYFIDNLAPGSYYAKFTLPANYTFTKKGDGTSVLDSNPDTTTGITPTFTIAASVIGETVTDSDSATLAQFVNPTIDAGVIFNDPNAAVLKKAAVKVDVPSTGSNSPSMLPWVFFLLGLGTAVRFLGRRAARR